MSVKFNADEIFEMAEELERNGAKFYRQVSNCFVDEKFKSLLKKLAQMEDEHLQTFKDMRNELSEQEKEVTTYDPEDEAAMYLRAMADGHVFRITEDPCKNLTGDETMQDILNMAIDSEKDSIVFYLGLRDFVASKSGKDKIDAIIREEMGHISVINKQMQEI